MTNIIKAMSSIYIYSLLLLDDEMDTWEPTDAGKKRCWKQLQAQTLWCESADAQISRWIQTPRAHVILRLSLHEDSHQSPQEVRMTDLDASGYGNHLARAAKAKEKQDLYVETKREKWKNLTASCCFFKMNGLGSNIQGTETRARKRSTSWKKWEKGMMSETKSTILIDLVTVITRKRSWPALFFGEGKVDSLLTRRLGSGTCISLHDTNLLENQCTTLWWSGPIDTQTNCSKISSGEWTGTWKPPQN